MFRPLPCLSVALVLTGVFLSLAMGQMAGSRGADGEPTTPDQGPLPRLDRKVAEGHIAIDGCAVARVRATDIRMVLAVTAEAETAQKCQQSVDATVERLKGAWSKMGIGAERIVVDFIAVLPRYQWTPEKHGSLDVEVEKKVGYRMQSNVHLAAKGDAEVQAALARALELGVTDIIGFDYWSSELDEAKVKVREQALRAARSKADALLGALFADRPPVINVQERTTVEYPESMYHSFTNVADDTASNGHRDVPLIKAYRPRNTYYRGLYIDSDVQPRELAMSPEISVVSTVRLYFKSPAAEGKKKEPTAPVGK